MYVNVSALFLCDSIHNQRRRPEWQWLGVNARAIDCKKRKQENVSERKGQRQRKQKIIEHTHTEQPQLFNGIAFGGKYTTSILL